MKRETISTIREADSPQIVEPGLSYPLGAQVTAAGVNFCVYSRHCSAVDLLLFDTEDAAKPCNVIRLDPDINRTFHYWHVFVRGVTEGQVYGLRVRGPFEPEQGMRFDPEKVLLDPYSRAVVNWQNYSRERACRPGDNCSQSLRSVVVDSGKYNWEKDAPLRLPYARSVIYELHVKGFTRNPNSGVSPEKRGTFAGLIEKIPYLEELGVTAVELMPVFQFDEQDAVSGLKNYWGYSPIAFFAPHGDYSSCKDPLGAIEEFKDMVKALHRAGVEVILDVVFNHTAEGNELGPTLSFRGLDNSAYYMLADDPAFYADYTGCGNTFKANSPVCQKLIMDCLHYWVSEMHVDGFRFDLASILSRDIFGKPQSIELPGILSAMEADPILAGTKLIAEAWDGAGLYQVGSFINDGDWFAEWNGPFRDDARRFIKGGNSTVKVLASRIAGSSDIYTNKDREPNRSINFITCHDGFTLNDLVSFDRKHNESNGENNRDGTDSNWSWNCGIEGPSDTSAVEDLRLRQIKNALCLLFLSLGTPMILMGDEIRRTQNGNNNAYCQNSDLSWMDWSLVDENDDLLKFVQGLISFTQSLELFEQDHLMCTKCGHCCCPHIQWHGTIIDQPDWSDSSHSLSFLIVHPEADEHVYVIFNAFWESLTFQIPVPPDKKQWHRIVDTAIAPVGVWTPEFASPVPAMEYSVKERSSVVLMALNKGSR